MSTSIATDTVPQPPGPPLAADGSLTRQIAGVAARLDQLRHSGQRGPLAELRRLSSREIPGDAFWAMVERFDIARGDEAFWLGVLPLMVRHPHQPGARPGKILEAAGISKSRFERWLRLDRAGARREAGRLLSNLKDDGLDWVALGHALHRWNDGDRYRLARDFFLARERRDSITTDGAD